MFRRLELDALDVVSRIGRQDVGHKKASGRLCCREHGSAAE